MYKRQVFAGEEGICAGCGVATLSISYYDLGYTTGETVSYTHRIGKVGVGIPVHNGGHGHIQLLQGCRVEEEQRFTREETEELIRKALTFSAEPPERDVYKRQT